MKDKLLMIHKTQFGYHNNAYEHAKYLRDKYNITFICFDSGRKHVCLDGVNVVYIPMFVTKQSVIYSLWRKIVFMCVTLLYLLFFKGKVIVYYFYGAHIYKIIYQHKKMLLDVRTLSLQKDKSLNEKENEIIRRTALMYDYVIFLSEAMREKLRFPKNKSSIVPLGAERKSNSRKTILDLRLLYVGTITNRNLEITLEGVKLFVERNPSVKIMYDVVGDGNTKYELESLISYAKNLGLTSVVFHGRIPNVEIGTFFDKCNIGVSFVPITDYFDHQPVTKTFEYIMSGLFTIATATSENKKVINSENGLLILDTSDSFASALEYVLNNRESINNLHVSETLEDYQWKNIVNNRLMPIIMKYA